MTAFDAAAVRPPRPSAVREFGASVVTIMVKELRSRMRGRRAFIVLTVYLGILALITYGVYVVVAPNARGIAGGGFGGGGQANASALIGQSIFTLLSIFQLILVCFIAPAFTAGQISMEREKQTLDLLISTPMRPGAIVIGKLVAALAFVVLMIVAAVPITAIVLMYGGASVDDIVRQQIVLLATALVLGAIGLFFSALLKRTQAATVLTYISVLVLTLGTTMLFIFWSVVIEPGREQRVHRPDATGTRAAHVREPRHRNARCRGEHRARRVRRDQLRLLAQLRGDAIGFDGGQVECQGDVCRPVDQFGNPVANNANASSGYWWPRVVITFVILAGVLTFAATRLVVPAGMRWALRRPSRRSRQYAATTSTEGAADDGAPVVQDLVEDPEP